MTEKEIRILLILSDVSQVSIARKCGKPKSYVHQVITGERAFPEIRQAIADAVGRPIKQLWPPEQKPNINVEQVNNRTKKNNKKQEKRVRGASA